MPCAAVRKINELLMRPAALLPCVRPALVHSCRLYSSWGVETDVPVGWGEMHLEASCWKKEKEFKKITPLLYVKKN